MGRFKFRQSGKAKARCDSESSMKASAKKLSSIDDSWKLLDYPTSFSDSDSADATNGYMEVPKKDRFIPRCVNTMPLEHTRYNIQTREVDAARDSFEKDWGVTFVENTARIGNEIVRSLVVSDLVDEGVLETAGLKCGDLVIGLNGEDTSFWTHYEMLVEVGEVRQLRLTVIPHKQQEIKYLLFIDMFQSDITHLWALNNLVSLHICKSKLNTGIVDLRGISCRGVLQELAVTKCEVECLTSILGLRNFTNLRRLNLNHNKISQLDEDVMGRLVVLEELRLGNNHLDKFPLVLTDMPELRDLSLVYNLISSVPSEVTKMRKLESLQLDHNYLAEMPEYLTQQLPALRSLTFSSNHLAWNESRIKDCFHLQLLNISDNGIRARTGLDNFGVTGRATLRKKGKGSKEMSLLRKALSASA